MATMPPQTILKARFGELAAALGLDLAAKRQGTKFYFTITGPMKETRQFVHATFPDAWMTSAAGDEVVYGLPLKDVQRVLGQATIEPAWLKFNDGVALRIAQQMRDDKDYRNLGILADALEEGGCTHQEILAHLRAGEPHQHACCWVVDLLIGPARRPPRPTWRPGM